MGFNLPIPVGEQLEAGGVGCGEDARIVEHVADCATSLQIFDIPRPRSIPVVQLAYVRFICQCVFDGGRCCEGKEAIYVVARVVAWQIAE